MVELGKRFGLRYTAARNYTLADDYAFLPYLARGENRYAFNIMSGSYRQSEVLVFDYHYETSVKDPKSEDQKTHYFLTPILVLVPAYFPEMRISPEGPLEKIADALGGQDIEFESAEFSSAFRVRSKNKRLAYDICNAQVIEYLLENRDMDILIRNCTLAMVSDAQLSARQIENNLERLMEFRLRLPDYLFAKT